METGKSEENGQEGKSRPGWIKEKLLLVKTQATILFWAARDARTPWFAKVLAGAVVAYALSPIDLIPDFIPVLGYLDDLLIVPAGLALAYKLIPAEVLAEARLKASESVPPEDKQKQ